MRRVLLPLGLVGGALALASLLAGCGGAQRLGTRAASFASSTSVPPKSSTSSTPSTSVRQSPVTPPSTALTRSSVRCQPSDLSPSVTLLQEGGGHGTVYYGLENTTTRPCYLDGGYPSLAEANAAGRVVLDYVRTPGINNEPDTQPASASGPPLTLYPGHSAYFLMVELAACNVAYHALSGGPFHLEIMLPAGGGTVMWSPSWLHWPSFAPQCPQPLYYTWDLTSTIPTVP